MTAHTGVQIARSDVVGSLLRPAYLRETRQQVRQGQTIGNNAYTFLSAEDGTINVRCGTSTGGGTHFILDLIAILFLADLGPEPLEMRAMQADRAARIAAARR